MDDNLDFVKGILCDLDGTLYFKGKAVEGAVITIQNLKDAGYKLLFLTNTDSKTPKSVLLYLHDLGFSMIRKEDVFTPIIAIKEFLLNFPEKKSYFVVSKEVMEEFQQFPQISDSAEIPDFVILGDFSDDWRVERLNLAFQYIKKGAELLGTQGNLFFLDREGKPNLYTGSFVQMISKASKISSPQIFGKPSSGFFDQALNLMDLKSHQVVVVGDDIDTDIRGAYDVGIKSILVKTGKSQESLETPIPYNPFKIINSIKSLEDLLL